MVEFERDIIGSMVAADLVVSMGGYNSVCEILQFAQRAVIIPRLYPRKEQSLRSRILEEQKLLSLLLPTDMSPEKLFNLIQSALNSGVQTQITKRRLLLKKSGLENLSKFLLNEFLDTNKAIS
jgi:predicted glycosyltransferase